MKIAYLVILVFIGSLFLMNSVYADVAPNPNFDKIIKTVPVGNSPWGIMFNPNNNKIYVANQGNDFVSVINEQNQVEKNITTGSGVIQLVLNKNNNDIYVTNQFNNSISIINSNDNVIKKINFTVDQIYSIVYNTNNHDIYTSAPNNHDISVINSTTNQVIKIINGSNVQNPLFLAYSPVTNEVYSVNNVFGNGTIDVINSTNQISKVIDINPTNADIQEMYYSPITHNVYVTDDNKIYVINTNDQFIKTLSVNTTTNTGIAFNTNTNEMYVGGFDQSIVNVFDVNDNLIKQISVPTPQDLVFDPINGYVYVTDDNSLVSVIDANPTITVPNQGGYDSSPTGGVMCPNSNCGSENSFQPNQPPQSVPSPTFSSSQAPESHSSTLTKTLSPNEFQSWLQSLGQKIVSKTNVQSLPAPVQQQYSAPIPVQHNPSPFDAFMSWIQSLRR